MAIRAVCPSCGRGIRTQEHAIGRNVRCPKCSHTYRLTADLVYEDFDEPPSPTASANANIKAKPAPEPKPRAAQPPRSLSTPPPAPAARPAAPSDPKPAQEFYSIDDRDLIPPRRPGKPLPVPPASSSSFNDRERERSTGLTLSLPTLIGGAAGVAILSMLLVWGAFSLSRDRQDAPPSVEAAATPLLNSVAEAPRAAEARANTPVSPVGASSNSDPDSVSVADAMQTEDAPVALAAATLTPARDASNEAKLRAQAAAANSRDDGANKTLSTADIAAESEPSVALIKGNLSSGTGFLVAPGLLATNSHVIQDEFISSLNVRFVSADESHKGPLKAELLYEDAERDLAVLSVKTDLPPLRVAKAYTFRKGEDVTVIGNPGMGDDQVLENAINRGVMSTKTQLDNHPFNQLSIAVNPGNSGGPVFDSSGRVIGIVTLKSSKQEATTFSIPIEDVHSALAKLAGESPRDTEIYNSRHRLSATVKNLIGGGALMFLMTDLYRADAQISNQTIKDLIAKIEPIVVEFNDEMADPLSQNVPKIQNDPLITPQIKGKISELNQSFTTVRQAYATGRNADHNRITPQKTVYKKLVTEIAAALKMEIPPALMTAFEVMAPAERIVIMTNGPQNFGSYASRLRQRQLGGLRSGIGTPGRIQRPPSAIDRLRQQRGRR